MELANNIAQRKKAPYCFKSAGVAVIGEHIDDNVIRVLEEVGIKTAYSPTHISEYNIDEFDAFHVMTQRQKITLCSYFKNKRIESKITVLGIADPFGRGTDAYRQCREQLAEFYEMYIK